MACELGFDNLELVKEIKDSVIAIAKEVAQKHWNRPAENIDASLKNGNPTDLVTCHDREIQRDIISLIMSIYPTHKFLGEERISSDGAVALERDDYIWIIDPIDGTTNFVHGSPQCCISIALNVLSGDSDGSGPVLAPVLGIIYQPSTDTVYYGIVGNGSYRVANSLEERLKTSSTSSLHKSLVGTEWNLPMTFEWSKELCERTQHRSGSPSSSSSFSYLDWMGEVVKRISSYPVHGIRCMGSGALNLVLVSLGHLDLYYELGLHVWDISAGVLIVQEAGGYIGTIPSAYFSSGSSAVFDICSRRVIAAANKQLYDEFVGKILFSPNGIHLDHEISSKLLAPDFPQ